MLDDAGRLHLSNGCSEVRLWEVCQISNGKRHVCTHLASSRSCRGQNQLDEKSAFRPCACDVAEFFKSTGWAFDAEFAISIDRECRDRTALMHGMNEQLGRTGAAP